MRERTQVGPVGLGGHGDSQSLCPDMTDMIPLRILPITPQAVEAPLGTHNARLLLPAHLLETCP